VKVLVLEFLSFPDFFLFGEQILKDEIKEIGTNRSNARKIVIDSKYIENVAINLFYKFFLSLQVKTTPF